MEKELKKVEDGWQKSIITSLKNQNAKTGDRNMTN